MWFTSRIRTAAFRRLPKSWQPAASYHYYRARALLDRELPFLCAALGPRARAIDVGANEGVYMHAFAATGAFVEAFEPNPCCFAVLAAYARRHERVHAHSVALGAQQASATLSVPARDGRALAGHGTLEPVDRAAAAYSVEVRTLDSYRFDDVAVIKIDVEGRELDVLRGARATLERCRPTLLLEIEQRHLRIGIADAFAEVAALGYTGSFLPPDSSDAVLRPLADFDVARHQSAAAADEPHSSYVNNFIFTPRVTASAFVKARA